MAVKKISTKRLIIAAIVLLLGNYLLFLTLWLLNKYDKVYFEQMLYQLKSPKGNVEGALLSSAYWWIGVLGTGFTLLEYAIYLLLSGRGKKWLFSFRKYRRYCRTSACRFFYKRALTLAVTMMVLSLSIFVTKFNVIAYVGIHTDKSDFIEQQYVDPAQAELVFPEEKRNLIFIFLESMENTFAEPTADGPIEADYIPELTKLAQENISFSNTSGIGGALAFSGTAWTAASMVSQTCGVPLKVSITADSYGTDDNFMPGVVSIGEILQEQNYRQVLLLGSDAEFHGRKSYFEQHGDYTIVDMESLKDEGRLPEDYNVWWGYEDEKLFGFAKEELEKLGQSGEPFNFTMLTADTHFPDGYACPLCEDHYEEQYPNVLSCSSKQLDAFLSWIMEQPFYENTTIVLSGDHLTMDPQFLNDIDEDYVRTTYNCIINAPLEPVLEKNRQYGVFDMYPTTLAAIGVEIKGNRLGLGTNLFSDVPTLTEEFGYEALEIEFQKQSAFYESELLRLPEETTAATE